MKKPNVIKNIVIVIGILALAMVCSLFMQRLDIQKHSTTIFVFAVFLISLWTDGYLYGVISSFI